MRRPFQEIQNGVQLMFVLYIYQCLFKLKFLIYIQGQKYHVRKGPSIYLISPSIPLSLSLSIYLFILLTLPIFPQFPLLIIRPLF